VFLFFFFSGVNIAGFVNWNNLVSLYPFNQYIYIYTHTHTHTHKRFCL
jgi:hypothetical protein